MENQAQSVQKNAKKSQQFVDYFNQNIVPRAQELESTREKFVNIVKIWSIIVAGITLVLAIAVIPPKITSVEALYAPLLVIAIGCIVGYTPVEFIRRVFSYNSKKKILPSLLSFWGKFSYIPPVNFYVAIYSAIKNKTGVAGFIQEITKDKTSNISINHAILKRLLDYNDVRYDDKIVGIFNDIKVELCELETAIVRRDSKKGTSRQTTFKGVIFSAVMNKKFKGMTAISNTHLDTNMLDHPRIGFDNFNATDILNIGKQLIQTAYDKKQLIQKNNELEKEEQEIKELPRSKEVRLEDPVFRQHFKVYSTDQIEARYILTTAFMNRILKLGEAYKWKIKAIFINNNIYILIDVRKNWFEMPFFKSSIDINNYKEFLNDFTKLLAITEILKLNQNIGM